MLAFSGESVKIDIDKLLAPTVALPKTDTDFIPTTFEEWVAVHGEPEYLSDRKTPSTDTSILVIEPPQEPVYEIDTAGIITEDKNGNMRLNYAKFIDVFAKINPLAYCNGVFYTPHGAISKDVLKQDIHFSLFDNGWKGRLDAPVKSILESLKDHCNYERLTVDDKVIPLGNGELHLGKKQWEFHHDEYNHCAYRLSVNYSPVRKPTPLFDKWLNDVFTPEDIPTVQEIFGYCLVPVTAAQEAFIFVGDAGVGKSGVGAILKGLLGNAFIGMETQQLVTERFQIAQVENKLVAYDDDLGSAALTETGLLKKLITADVPITGERKFADPHEFDSYCRIVASANFMLSSLYDDSDGFYRRLHPILVKPKDPNRKNINRFYETILEQERSQILAWALDGLRRVIDNGWEISWSERSRKYLSQAKAGASPFRDFLDETCTIGEGNVSTAELKRAYKSWCRENGMAQLSDRRLGNWMVDNCEKMGIEPSRNVVRGGKQVRGYYKLRLRSEWNPSMVSI